ncbi:MAG: hypothetical protein JST51_11775 [Armatimonadetes bacterium]|nr:hypothetical protein [Armatimonadota bacterium]
MVEKVNFECFDCVLVVFFLFVAYFFTGSTLTLNISIVVDADLIEDCREKIFADDRVELLGGNGAIGESTVEKPAFAEVQTWRNVWLTDEILSTTFFRLWVRIFVSPTFVGFLFTRDGAPFMVGDFPFLLLGYVVNRALRFFSERRRG